MFLDLDPGLQQDDALVIHTELKKGGLLLAPMSNLDLMSVLTLVQCKGAQEGGHTTLTCFKHQGFLCWTCEKKRTYRTTAIKSVRGSAGVGYKLNTELEQRGITTAAELRSWTLPDLTAAFGDRQASFLHRACRGQVCSVMPVLIQVLLLRPSF